MNKRICILFAGVLAFTAAEAQNYAKKFKNAKGIEVVYRSVYKGKVYPGNTIMKVNGDEVKLETVLPGESRQPKEKALRQDSYIDYSRRCSYRRAVMPNDEVVYTYTPFEYGEGFKPVREEKYLGLNCKVVRSIVNSNTIDVWYTNDIALRGTPQTYAGVPDGLVLRVVRNGDSVEEATEIKGVRKPGSLLPSEWGHYLDASNYSYAINQSGVVVVPVFDQQTLCFNNAKLPDGQLEPDKVYAAAGGSVVLKKVKLPDDITNRQVFVEAVQYSDGDAYDRTGSVFMIPTGKEQSFIDALRDLKSVPSFHSGDTDYHGLTSTPSYDVPLELMRFFTGFGVRKYNHVKVPGQTWSDSVLYKSEVTAVAERLKGEVWIGAYIGNWDAKGHKLSVKLKYYPSEDRKMPKTLPLFNTVNYMEQAGQPYPVFMLDDSLTAMFELKEDVKDARLYYITTGHGGWGGGDEFNQKPNTIYVDGTKVITFIPWRDDCGTYRNWNPCSGNFSNGLSSSDLSRSNWCPGTMTNPEYIYVGELKAGKHTINVKIPQGKPEGGSNSYWCISGTLIY